MTYDVLHVDELDRYPSMSGAPVLMPLRKQLGLRAFGANCWTAALGSYVIEPHSEPNGDEELYVVLRGRVRSNVGGEDIDAGVGTCIRVPPDTPREAIAVEPETVVLAIGTKPGEAFEPKSWEDSHIAYAQARAQGEDEARAFIAQTLAEHPDSWQAAYNAACFEALSDNVEGAFEHLERALALGPPAVRQLAQDGADFHAIRSDPRWKRVVGETR